jgi:histidinol-phosphate aminotransferase
VTTVPVRDDLSALEGYHSPQVQVSVRLNTNESPIAPPPAWVRAYQQAVADIDWNRYPNRTAADLREAIAKLHGVRPDQVFAANGSNEVLLTILLTYAGPGRRVVTFEPTYQLHAHIARITGATVVSGERNPDFTLDERELRRVVDDAQPSVAFLCSPNNPTGLVEPPEIVDALLECAPGLVVIDEAYAEFSSWSALDRVGDDLPMAVVRTFSKTWGMAAARLGYVVGPAWMVAELEKVVLPYHLDAAKQVGGRLALAYVDEMNDRVGGVISERTRVSERMTGLGVEVFPSGANFVLFRVASGRGRAVWQGVLDRDVLVRDCSGWARLDDCLRVTIGTPAENDAFLAALAATLAEVSV